MRPFRQGATLVEVLIVAIILLSVALVVVPQFSEAGLDAREGRLRTELMIIRRQLELYKTEHNGRYPTATTEDEFIAQLTRMSAPDGRTSPSSAPGLELGPYLRTIPVNPYTGGNRVDCSGAFSAQSADWFYDPCTGQFQARRPAAKTNNNTQHGDAE